VITAGGPPALGGRADSLRKDFPVSAIT
jgi:hypothetical protein